VLGILAGCSGEVVRPLGEPSYSGPSFDDAGSVGPLPTPPGLVDGTQRAPLDCRSEPVNAGATPLQRLSRAHYANSVRDLLQLPAFDVELLSEDEKVGAFDGNTVAPVSELVIEQYITAAERVARDAMPRLESLVPCERAKLGDAVCAAQFIDAFGMLAYRRPLSSDEQAAYRALHERYRASQSHADGLRVVVQTMLQSPNFLYHVELAPTPSDGTGATRVVPLDPYELAARVSFFLISSTPDAPLLAAAQTGKLTDAKGLASEVSRLLSDPRARDTLASFHLQWLQLDGMARVSKDRALFPEFDRGLVTAMRDETVAFVDHVVRKGDAKLETLLTAPYSFPKAGLLALYGLPANTPTGELPVPLDPTQRAGLLTQPSFLSVHAHHDQTSPVQRGKVLIRNVLCQTLPDPPADVDTTPPDPSPTATTRERLLEHRASASCSGCHQRIDGIGLGFEQYDAMGRFRSSEAGKPVDARGEVVGTKTLNGEFVGAVELAGALADSGEVQQCVTTQWLRFALGRLEAEADRCSLGAVLEQFHASDHDIRALLGAIVSSDAFRMKRVAAQEAP
jgi:hypothetical protein